MQGEFILDLPPFPRPLDPMPLTLNADDLTRLREAQEALLSVRTSASVADWCADVVEKTGALLRNERTMMVLACHTGLELISQPAMTPFLTPFEAAIEGAESGTVEADLADGRGGGRAVPERGAP